MDKHSAKPTGELCRGSENEIKRNGNHCHDKRPARNTARHEKKVERSDRKTHGNMRPKEKRCRWISDDRRDDKIDDICNSQVEQCRNDPVEELSCSTHKAFLYDKR